MISGRGVPETGMCAGSSGIAPSIPFRLEYISAQLPGPEHLVEVTGRVQGDVIPLVGEAGECVGESRAREERVGDSSIASSPSHRRLQCLDVGQQVRTDGRRGPLALPEQQVSDSGSRPTTSISSPSSHHRPTREHSTGVAAILTTYRRAVSNVRLVCIGSDSVTFRPSIVGSPSAVHPRAWYREFRELVLTAAVYNLEQALKQRSRRRHRIQQSSLELTRSDHHCH